MIANAGSQPIVVPWSFKDNSKLALNRALEMVDDARLIRVVHVAPPLMGPDNGVLYDAAQKRKCRELEIRFRNQLSDGREKDVRFHVVFGYVVHELSQFAERSNAQLIVMDSFPKKRMSRILFGDTAKRVERMAPCPVLVLHGSDAAVEERFQSSQIHQTLNA